MARIAGQLRQLYVTQGDQDQHSIESAAILPHILRFHTAPTYRNKLITQPTQS